MSGEPRPLPAATPLAGFTVVFDLDGTLVDSAPDIVATLNLLLSEEGHPPVPLADARDMIGEGAWALLVKGFSAAGANLDESRRGELVARFIAHYRGRLAEESRPFPGAIAAADALLAMGARLAVCTNKRGDLAREVLGGLGLLDRFAAVVGGDAAPAAKPDPRPLRLAIERAGGDPARALMVGDSESDAGAARALGIPLVLVSFGYTPVPARALHPDVLIERFAELPDACLRLSGADQNPIARDTSPGTRSSAGEHLVHTEGVTGSIPVASTRVSGAVLTGIVVNMTDAVDLTDTLAGTLHLSTSTGIGVL